MKRETKIRFGIGFLTIGTMLSFVGALSSTIAWYAYSTRTQVSFKGTSVSKTKQLQVGLVTDVEFPEDMEERFGITYVTDGEGTKYAFTAPGLGLSSDFINYFEAQTHHATNELYPVTSNEFNEGDTLNLMNSPIYGHPIMDDEAEDSRYCYLPFCFRVVKVGATGEQIYAPNQDIWLTDARVQASSGFSGDIYKAIRCYIENGDMKFLLNPSSSSTAGGETKVSGLLDLNRDGCYDTEYNSETDHEEEMIYGEYSGSIPERTYFPNGSELIDMNGSGNDSETTFTSRHKKEAYGFTSINSIQSKTAKYRTMSQIMPQREENGVLTGGQILTTTSDDTFAIAKLDMKVYIEGWDFSVINQNINQGFDLGLQFEINMA